MKKLSQRMQLIADNVIPGECCADIGTDHGFIPIYLKTAGICQHVILTDIAEGPLAKARENIEKYDCNVSDLRLGAGLEPLENAEASSVIVAGMGGELISAILGADIKKAKSFKRIIMQPRTHSEVLRHFLVDNGFPITGELMAREDGRLCEIIISEQGALGESFSCEADYIAAPLLHKNRPELYSEFLEKKISSLELMIQNLKNSKTFLPAVAEDAEALLAQFYKLREGIK